MKGIFRKSAVCLAVLGLAGSAYAGTVNGAFFGVEGLDLQARNGDLDFITVFPVGSFGTLHTYAIHPSYSWDWRIYGGFTFCGNEDLTVSWLRYHTTDHNDFGTPVGTVVGSIPASVVRWLNDADWADVYAKVNFDLDDVYGVFGHTVHMGPWSVRWAGGVEWFKLKSDMQVEATVPLTPGFQSPGLVYGYESNNTTRGVGPRVEFDFTYQMPYNFEVFARPNMSLLISTRNIDLEPFDTEIQNTYEFSKRYVVVPRIGIRLGVGFNYGWGGVGGEGLSCNTTGVSIEAGWHAESYIHAIERPEGFGNDDLSPAPSNITTKTSNFGVQGFFIGVRLGTLWL